jgi:hypothetical protein
MEKKQVFTIVFAVSLFYGIWYAVQNVMTSIWWLDSRQMRAGTPWFTHMSQVFGWILILVMVAIIGLNVLMMCGRFSDNMKKLFAYASALCLVGIIVIWIVLRASIPLGDGITSNPPAFNSTDLNMFLTLRGWIVNFLITGAIMTAISWCNMFCCKKDKTPVATSVKQ